MESVFLTVVGASGLPHADVLSHNDTYVKVGLAPTSPSRTYTWSDVISTTIYRSVVVMNTENPKWWFPVQLDAPAQPSAQGTAARDKTKCIGAWDVAAPLLAGAAAYFAPQLLCAPPSIPAAIGATALTALSRSVARTPSGVAGKALRNHVVVIQLCDWDPLTGDDVIGEAHIPVAELLSRKDAVDTVNTIELPVSPRGRVTIATADNLIDLLQGLQSAGPAFAPASASFLDQTAYGAHMLEFALAGLAEHDGFTEWWLKKTRGSTTGLWEGPGRNAITVTDYKTVDGLMRSFPRMEADGRAKRANYLGFQRLNNLLWRHHIEGARCIGLGFSKELHDIVRPLLVKRLARPVVNLATFWRTWLYRNGGMFSTGDDIRVAVCQLLFKIHLNRDLSTREAADFMELQAQVIRLIALPEAAAALVMDVKTIVDTRRKYEERVVKDLERVFGEEVIEMSYPMKAVVASAFLDSLMFAGGQSVPTVIAYALALPFGGLSEGAVPPLQSDIVERYVAEVLRVFPPVSGFAYERNDGTTMFLNLHMAQRDTSVWGEDAREFRVRPWGDYNNRLIGWGVGDRACPAAALSADIVNALLLELNRFTDQRRRGEVFGPDAWHVDEDEIHVNAYTITTLRLSPIRGNLDLSDDVLIDISSSPVYGVDDVLDNVDLHTRLFVNLSWQSDPFKRASFPIALHQEFPNKRPLSIAMKNEHVEIVQVEEKGGPLKRLSGSIQRSVRAAVFAASQEMPLVEKSLVPIDEARAVAVLKAFAHALPVQYSTRGEMHTDESMSDVCFNGMGQPYLIQGDFGPVHADATFKIDLCHLFPFAVREPFVRYGACAYFSDDKRLLAIFVSAFDRCVLKGDEGWYAAKFMFRSSLITEITIVRHLVHTHLIVANTAAVAAHRHLSAGNPLSRFLTPHIHRTFDINWAALQVLVPEYALAFRMWGFTKAGWRDLLTASFTRLWTTPLEPSKAFVANDATAPFYEQSGRTAFTAVKTYAKQFCRTFMLKAGPKFVDEARAMWDEVTRVHYKGVGEFGEESLAKYLAHVVFTVSFQHEVAGSVAEYLVSPRGYMPKVARSSMACADAQTFVQALSLIALTGSRQVPLLCRDWLWVWGGIPNAALFKAHHEAFIQTLTESGEHTFAPFDPRVVESSVSI